jgi:alginate O-acetyltransferase complex protein AlgI
MPLMLLHTPAFLLVLAAIVLVYWRLPRPAWRKYLLLLASYLLYASFDVRFVLILLGTTTVTFLLGQRIPGSPRARALVAAGICFNLGALAYFKYSGFFLSNVDSILRLAGIPMSPAIQVLVPIGLSFYTFQAIAYILEISRGKMLPAQNAADFALYLAFFPKLLAGPFVRPQEFLRQISEPRSAISGSEVQSALHLLLTGLFRKIVIADSIASLADISFRAAGSPHAGGFPSPLYLCGFYLYAFQIYADFSGYTNIARGSAALLGFSLPENFRQPYFSLSPGDFWNRWHITLSQWFREYVFFPLSRWGLVKTERRYPRLVQTAATLITMILVGLWHGAAWTYLLWGAWHGILVAVDRLLHYVPRRWWEKVLAAVVTFHLVGIGWVLFRSPSLSAAGGFLAGMFSFQQMSWFPMFFLPALIAGILLFGMDALSLLSPRFSGWIQTLRPVGVFAALTAIIALWLLQAISSTGTLPFIYGSF